jgi:catechol 2,3-dioxygenase-like lactoylglutathione lyase family enzyme
MHPTYTLLYVDDPQASGRFYAGILEAEPVENSATFVLFVLPGGIKLGLWSRHTVSPAASGTPGAAEVGFSLEGYAQVDATHAAWTARGIHIAQAPTATDYGRAFLALDPDGHRLRVFAPGVDPQ